ncbi:nonsense-mediated mRNA decay factor SMG8 [Anopheles bellator]|uniref:nonsense-mediated mRNA decay factor SMG8 n=1 Tax=Anopheles bellator TaxID=139047 RepID=UPI00264955E3|nr:nonsense-mediated mRNA decay factor SMG8 [Anopheles bellator]
MDIFSSFIFPNVPHNLRDTMFSNRKHMVVVGVLGKSTDFHCNKLIEFNVLHIHPTLMDKEGSDGRIKFYYRTDDHTMFVHFDTTFDNFVLLELADQMMGEKPDQPSAHFVEFNSAIRTRFARVLLFALQICHIVVLVETAVTFDMSYLSLFKSLKIIREKHVLRFLPEMLKRWSFMGKECRLCNPRLIFMFNLPDSSEPYSLEEINTLQMKMEEFISKTLRNEFIITNNSGLSLFALPRNKPFVFYIQRKEQRQDPVIDTINMLSSYLVSQKSTGMINKEEENQVLENLKPYEFFGFPNYKLNVDRPEKKEERSVLQFVQQHVNEAMEYGFDDGNPGGRQRNRTHFVLPPIGVWYEVFQFMHRLFIENPNKPSYAEFDSEYRLYLESFYDIVDIDEQFFGEISEQGLHLAMMKYKEKLPMHYSTAYHEAKYGEALNLLMLYARGPQVKPSVEELKQYCEAIWLNGKQQCEYPSLRGNPCLMGKHKPQDPSEHSSGVIYVSSCNCGRTQGHREDPYTIRQANFEFYQIIAQSCSNCNRLERVQFPIFEPSISDFRAAEFINKNFSNLMSFDKTKRTGSDVGPQTRSTHEHSPLSGNQRSQNSSQSLSFIIDSDDDEETKEIADPMAIDFDTDLMLSQRLSKHEAIDAVEAFDLDIKEEPNAEDRIDELEVKVGELGEEMGTLSLEPTPPTAPSKQPSTTEYLPGMLHAASPAGLLPRFPSWSLVCLGSSSIYTHNSGLPEHVQSGFLSGSNFLLPWDVSVRLEHAQSWAASYEKIRNRKKGISHCSKSYEQSNTFTLKLFIGIEYECLRGHRFCMDGPNSIIRNGTEIARDSGSKVVFNDMPIYFPCPCRNTVNNTAQLMRVHIVTPKAPVHVIIDPKVKIIQNNAQTQSSLTFTTGVKEPIRLSQSSYWILRLPFLYEGDTGPLVAPVEVDPATATTHGVLMEGMFGVRENELNDSR